MTSKYQIETTLEAPNKYLAKVFKVTTDGDMRETYEVFEVIGIALDENEEDAIYNAVQEAFFS